MKLLKTLNNSLITEKTEIIASCLICENEKSLDLPCKCKICEGCLFQWITFKNFEILYSPVQIITCPNHICKQTIQFEWLQQNLSRKNMACINEILFKKYINSSEEIRKCPNNFCSYLGWVDINQKCSEPLKCELCKEKWIDPSIRSYKFFYLLFLYLFNIKEIFLNDLTELNVLLWSKPCFHCGIKIYKTQGCDHMTCSNCKKEFCYNCMASHSNTNDNNYYYFMAICGCKYFTVLYFLGILFYSAIGKILSSFFYIRIITYYFFSSLGITAIGAAWVFLLCFLFYPIIMNYLPNYQYSRSPHVIIKIICFITFVVLLNLSLYFYFTNDSFYFYTNFILIEVLITIIGTGLFYLIRNVIRSL